MQPSCTTGHNRCFTLKGFAGEDDERSQLFLILFSLQVKNNKSSPYFPIIVFLVESPPLCFDVVAYPQAIIKHQPPLKTRKGFASSFVFVGNRPALDETSSQLRFSAQPSINFSSKPRLISSSQIKSFCEPGQLTTLFNTYSNIQFHVFIFMRSIKVGQQEVHFQYSTLIYMYVLLRYICSFKPRLIHINIL